MNREQHLLALTTDPNFVKGLEAGQMGYQEVYGEALPPLEDILEEIEDNLSETSLAEQYAVPYVRKRMKISHAYHLGFLISWLDAYTTAKEQKHSRHQEQGNLPVCCIKVGEKAWREQNGIQQEGREPPCL